MAKKIKHEEHENHERWLVSYADFITLLFAFFVVMYSISSVNEGKFRTVSESIQAALRPVVSHPAADVHFNLGDYKSSLIPTLSLKTQFIRRIEEVLNKVNKDVQAKDNVIITEIDRGVMITIADSLLFESGRAEIRAEALPVLEGLAEVLAVNTSVKEVRVQGHTDNVPIRSTLFPSNWELSATRAAMVARMLTELYRIQPEQVSAVGYAEFHAIADNLTPENRAKNRRVELLVLMNDQDRPL
ncbi:MAG TPA: flagellar motor protein MotB [Nitrospiraceae bacterium]|nr:flagellar motor protein MotB [Nitrospiraceae bacterium]